MEICLNENSGIPARAKVCELCDETFNEFSNAPFEFEITTLELCKDTQSVYCHACIANHFSDNYLLYCKQLENISVKWDLFVSQKQFLSRMASHFRSLLT